MYAKLFTSIYQGTLRGNSHGLLVFTNLLAHADQAGVVDIHPKAIADEVGLTESEVRTALVMLESPDEESRTPDMEGRRIVRTDEHRAWGWSVVNYAKYRAIRNEDDRREQNRLAQQRWREKNKPRVSSGETDKPIQKQIQKQKQRDENTGAARPAAARLVLSVADLVAEGVELKHAQDWIKVRGKVPLTATAWDAVKREATRAAITPAAAVKLSAENSWRGFKAEWVAKANGHPIGKQQAIEEHNRQVGEEWQRQEEARDAAGRS